MAFRGAERRLRTRYRVRVPFVLKGADSQVRGTTRNISLLGISAYAESPLNQVQPVQCLLRIPSKAEPLAVQGTVIRCQPLEAPHADGPYEIGVFFKEFQGDAETELIKFLNQVVTEEQNAIKEGYRELKQRLTARRRRKRTEAARKPRRKKERLRKRRLRLAREKRRAQKRGKVQKQGKVQKRSRTTSRKGRPSRRGPRPSRRGRPPRTGSKKSR